MATGTRAKKGRMTGQTHHKTSLQRLGLWITLPLLAALLLFQQAGLHDALTDALRSTPAAYDATPAHIASLKPAKPEMRLRGQTVLDTAPPLPPPFHPRTTRLSATVATGSAPSHSPTGWQARAPPFIPASQTA
ncbi:MAG: hypothetical protein A3D16_19390 [Rhodobacterales bacterium RIFCSPHIGHO2_02_FULL_62_130]|nr:MAG: hypothetical protein A3D16_19390 [Rhodobacterales bacterium RIFCSPHIGHO2_02_FULL_62_130]